MPRIGLPPNTRILLQPINAGKKINAVLAITLMMFEISAICGYISISAFGPNKPFIVSKLLIPINKPAVTIAGNIGIKISPNNLIKRCTGFPFCAAAFFASSFEAS
ncbi:Uncharacterised protein [Staphylococcus aureus]|nr:Uncharacterised protein [Staphylococcus aureus]CPJ57053.1 Uncharacterised protein [Staphylococcus aureus]CPJ57179.1 Uncharacterised protein [Staphylococcus aureus]